MRVYLDTSFLLASIWNRHERHVECLPLYRTLVASPFEAYTSHHALAESYGYLTGTVRNPRLGSADSAQAVDSIRQSVKIVALDERDYAQLIFEAGERHIRGGAVYDYIHLFAAKKCGAERIYTLDPEDFTRLKGEAQLEIVTP